MLPHLSRTPALHDRTNPTIPCLKAAYSTVRGLQFFVLPCSSVRMSDQSSAPLSNTTYVCRILRVGSEELYVEVVLPEDLTQEEAQVVADYVLEFAEKPS